MSISTFRCPICETVGIRRRICPRCLGGGIFTLLAPSTPLLGAARSPTAQISPLRLSEIEATPPLERTGLKVFDDALGGLGPGRTVLLSGEPGAGKTSLALKLADCLPSLYASGEEAGPMVKAAAEKLSVDNDALLFMAESNLDVILSTATRLRPKLLVLNSINTTAVETHRARAGTGFQINAVIERVVEWTAGRSIMSVIISRLTWEHRSAGPRNLEHDVDAVLYLRNIFADCFDRLGQPIMLRRLEVRKSRPPFSGMRAQWVPEWA